MTDLNRKAVKFSDRRVEARCCFFSFFGGTGWGCGEYRLATGHNFEIWIFFFFLPIFRPLWNIIAGWGFNVMHTLGITKAVID